MQNSVTYDAFMLDHAAGNLSSAMSLAGDLHVLLSDSGAEVCDTWRLVAHELAERPEDHNGNMDRACELLSGASDTVRWRRGLSGAQYAKAGPKGGKLMRLLPGKSVPTHGHRSLEVTVVLEGQLSDGIRVYNPGEIVFGEPGVQHKPAAKGDVPCVCYVAKK